MSDPSEDDITRYFADALPDLEAICNAERYKYSRSKQNWIIAKHMTCALLFAGVLIWFAFLFQQVTRGTVEFSCRLPAIRITMSNGAELGNWSDSQSTLSALDRPTPTQTAFELCVQNHPLTDLTDMLIIVAALPVLLVIIKVLAESLNKHYDGMRHDVQAILDRAKFDGILLKHIEPIAGGLIVLSLLTAIGFILSTVL